MFFKLVLLSIVDIVLVVINGWFVVVIFVGFVEKIVVYVVVYIVGLFVFVSLRLVIRICCDFVRIVGLFVMCFFGLFICLVVI